MDLWIHGLVQCVKRGRAEPLVPGETAGGWVSSWEGPSGSTSDHRNPSRSSGLGNSTIILLVASGKVCPGELGWEMSELRGKGRR